MIRPLSLALFLAFLGVCAPSLRAQAAASDPLRRLAILVGSWDVEDVYQPVSGAPIRETGVRRCAWALLDRYIECVTRARNASGREREYRWLINFDTQTKRYELTGVFNNVTFRIHQSIQIDSTGTVWNIRSPPYVNDGIEQWSGAQLRFDGNDRAVWTSYRNLDTTPVTQWAQSSRETWVRRP